MMKKVIFLALVLAPLLASYAELFKVSEVPSIRYKREKLIELFGAAKEQHYIRSDGVIIPMPQLSSRREKITQVLSEDQFLTSDADCNTSHVVSLVGMDAAEDEHLVGYFMSKGTYTYTTVLGASATKRSYYFAPERYKHLMAEKYIESNKGSRLTKDTFLSWIKEGNKVPVYLIETCRKCQGSGETSVGIGERIRCPVCNGASNAPKRYEIIW